MFSVFIFICMGQGLSEEMTTPLVENNCLLHIGSYEVVDCFHAHLKRMMLILRDALGLVFLELEFLLEFF